MASAVEVEVPGTVTKHLFASKTDSSLISPWLWQSVYELKLSVHLCVHYMWQLCYWITMCWWRRLVSFCHVGFFDLHTVNVHTIAAKHPGGVKHNDCSLTLTDLVFTSSWDLTSRDLAIYMEIGDALLFLLATLNY